MSRQRVLLMGVLVFFLIGSMLPSSSIMTISSIPKAHAVSHSIKLTGAFYSGWNGTNPGPTITVTKGDSVSMTLVSGDGAPHTFIIDVAKAGVVGSPNCTVDKCSSQFTTTTNYPFTVDFGPGRYTYYCSVHLTAMVGTFIVPGPDYSVSTSPSSLPILQGANANSTVSITSLNNFAGSVTLSASPSSPPGLLTSSFSVNPVIVPASGPAKSNFTISVPTSASGGSYIITVTASNSTTFSHSTTVSVIVPDFSITPSPASLTINSGALGTSTLTITGSNGFSGTVSLATTVPSGRATATPSPTSVPLSPTTTSATSTLNVSSALGVFNVTITATSGGTTHSTKVLVNGADFSITTASTSVNVNQGSSATLMITLSSVNGFSGAVALSAVSSTGGPPVTLSPTSLQVPPTGSVSATLTVTASSSGAYSTPVSPGSYTITLNATMGPLSHTETIPLTVTSPSSSLVGILTNPVVIGGIAGAVAVVAIAVYGLSRRSKK